MPLLLRHTISQAFIASVRRLQGNPYLLQPCQDIDECKLNRCMDHVTLMNFNGSPICENVAGGYTCYSNVTRATCDFDGRGGGRCYNKPEPPLPSRAYRIRTCFAGLLPPLLPIAGASPDFCHRSTRLLTSFRQTSDSIPPLYSFLHLTLPPPVLPIAGAYHGLVTKLRQKSGEALRWGGEGGRDV
ncbi:hypothetical protein Pyn_18495 [Prunus yedoensis var. nudiflora]|uniref:Uncharacterized protein n=1 Tax=Prunus yedoensis var. nudiflora TaxID=2094558 RepID=A0A314Y4K6_PRUYE|nr:hypothetical protein Pyn_18495 [Prunus yedoensis var. nudiflora]